MLRISSTVRVAPVRGALAAKELGGSLVAQSDGPGKGAVFTLALPRLRHASALSARSREILATLLDFPAQNAEK
jgi:hypothetical protein